MSQSPTFRRRHLRRRRISRSIPALESLLLEQVRFDAAIFGAERVGDAWFRFAEAPRPQSGGVETLRGEIGDDGRCAPLRQSKVILLGAGCVGMAVDFK